MRNWTRKVAVALSLAISGTAAFALLPAVAAGATAHIEIKRVYYTAGTVEENDISISLVGSNYVLSDPGALITAGPGCTASGSQAVCPAAEIIGITVNTADEADSARNNTSTPSTLSGGDGNDSLQGGNGNDTLRGNRGLDTHSGGPGDDFIDTRGDKGDVVTCGVGNDFVNADSGDSVAADCETVDRGDEPPPAPVPTPGPAPSPNRPASQAPTLGPTSRPSPSAARLLGSTETRKLDPGACAKDISGTSGGDYLDGTPLGDVLFGLPGDDVLNGLGGDDCIFGGRGSDRLSGGEGDDRLFGGENNNNNNNKKKKKKKKQGSGGNDQISGDSGNDLVIGDSGNDRLTGGDGSDRLRGSDGNDRLSGGAGDDRLKGGRGRNRLSGGSGNDRLNGVNGRFDRLNCGPGVDSVSADRKDRVRGCERIRRR
jgi:Ca2+-binding RTX toxin-like protein